VGRDDLRCSEEEMYHKSPKGFANGGFKEMLKNIARTPDMKSRA